MSVTRVDYVRTLTHVESSETTTIERGRLFISEDGFRTRVDRILDGEYTSELVRPAADGPDGYAAERLDLNHDALEAVVRRARYFRPVGSPAPPRQMSQEETAEMSPNWLGYRTIGPLVLSGFRVIDEADDVLDLWHVAGSPIADAVERRSVLDGVVDEVDVTNVERVTVDESLFDTPSNYRQRRQVPWLR